MPSITGTCLCGAVAYELTADPVWAHNCHCSRCRKTRGGPFASNLFVPLSGFRFTRGEDQLHAYQPPDAERFTHVFCGTCGSTVPWRNETRGVAVVPMGSLDSPPGIAPRAHIYVEFMAPWFVITDDLPQCPGEPGS